METLQDRAFALAELRQRLEPALGKSASQRVKAFRNGGLYVDSTVGAALWSWFVDSVLVNCTAVGVGVLYFVSSSAGDRGTGAVVIAVALMIVLPLLYGGCYADGRALGARLAGTRSVRVADGRRIGPWKAGWAMLVRTLLLPFIFWVALGEVTDIGEVRVSIDESATRRLRETGITSIA